jgi:hypothetical protein
VSVDEFDLKIRFVPSESVPAIKLKAIPPNPNALPIEDEGTDRSLGMNAD